MSVERDFGIFSSNQISNQSNKFTDKSSLLTAIAEYGNGTTSGIQTYGNINSWDVSQITDFSDLSFSWGFNQDISNWDVSNGTRYGRMFFNYTHLY